MGDSKAASDPPPPLAAKVMWFDEAMGQGERVLVAMIFATLVAVGFYRTFVDVMWNERPLWSIELIKVCVFAIAMLGAAFATHLNRNFSLDLVSHFLGQRSKAYLRIAVNLTTILAALLLYHGGELVRESLAKAHETHELVPMWVVGWFMPIAGILILIHSINHTIVEVVYLLNGRTAPEPDQAVG
jgi:TRAP-type C4-dicarboxylate transport system permease small subunit